MSWGFTGYGLPIKAPKPPLENFLTPTPFPVKPLARPTVIETNNCSLRWLFIDFNSYFASVEQQFQPHLRGKPTIVVPMYTDSTCAIAVSYEARVYGIKTGTPVWEAKQRCPDLQITMARHELYVKTHQALQQTIEECIPVSQVCSIDEFACELLSNEQTPEFAKSLASQIKANIAKQVGPYIKCSIGIGPNLWLAKQATEIQKPNGLIILETQHLPGPLLQLRLQDLTGIGHNLIRRLHNAGIYSIDELWRTAPKQLRRLWGSVAGEIMWYRLHGYPDPSEIRGQEKSLVGHSRVLPPSQRLTSIARLVGRRLLAKAAARLRRYNLTCQKLFLSVKTPGWQSWAAEISFAAHDDSFRLLARYEELWADMLYHLKEPEFLKKISLSLSGLQDNRYMVMDLFSPYTNAKRHKALSVLDNLNQKYGKDTLTIGPLPKDEIETKIAFSRIPELSEFLE